MAKSDLPTFDKAIEMALEEVDGPVDVKVLINRVLEIRPSSAKNPSGSIRTKIRDYHTGRNVVFLDRDTIMPLRVAMPGVRFRIPLSDLEVDRGVLIFDPSFRGWWSYPDKPEDFQFIDEKGQKLSTKVVSVRQKMTDIFGNSDVQSRAFDLSDWSSIYDAKGNDSILVTFESREPKRFRLELEPEKERRRHQQEIDEKNQELADILFDMLESSYHEDIDTREAIPTAYLLLSDPKGYPGDHWINVIERDSRMKLSFIGITYAEKRNFLESILMEDEPLVDEKVFTPKEGNQIYSFKVALKHRKSLWRVIEIQGKQTLGDFDGILRKAFGHDTVDHLSGFWKLVRRGKGNRFREIDLGDIDPFGEGSGADVKIAGLELQVGDTLRYVYDFGDWIEHEITLEAIEPPKVKVKYPRISEQNKPRYKYCEHCKDEGRKTVAEYVCIWCSNDEQREVLICEDCLYKYHEDHYVDEMIY